MKASLVFARKSTQNLKCYYVPAKSLAQIRLFSGKHTLNQHV